MSCHTVCGMVAPMKTFIKENCVGFKKTNEKFGGFSNMCSGYVINNGVVEFPTSEHLYQVCKFGEYPDIQRELISEKNPMIMKNKTKKYHKRSVTFAASDAQIYTPLYSTVETCPTDTDLADDS